MTDAVDTPNQDIVPDQEVNPNAPVPASADKAYLALTLMHCVPYIVSSMFFYFLYGCFTAEGMFQFVQSKTGQMCATLCFAGVIGCVMWGLFTLLSFWLHVFQRLFRLPHRAFAFIILLPSFVLGPFYSFSILAIAAFKRRNRTLFVTALPGIAIGYFVLYGMLNILSGELAVNWVNAFLVPGGTLALYVCSVMAVYHGDGNQPKPSRKVAVTAIVLTAVWLAVSVFFWILAMRTEADFGTDIAKLEEAYGRPLTNRGMLDVYFHDGQSSTPLDNALAKTVSEGPRSGRDERKPTLLDVEILELLDQANYSETTVKALADWNQANTEFFKEMDAATMGPLFKDTLTKDGTGNRYRNRYSIISNLNVWMSTYHGRLHGMISEPPADFAVQALELLKRMTWLRDSALDDPFMLANGHCVVLENRRLNAMQTLLSSGQLNDGQLSEMFAGLQADSEKWEERTSLAAWAALAWYVSNVQDVQGDADMGPSNSQSAFNDLVFGYSAPMHFWMLRMDGRWTLDFYLEQLGKPHMMLMPLEEEAAYAKRLPATATTAINLVFPVRHQFIPVRAKQLALLQAIAVERYRLKNGALPKSLQDLVPTYMTSLPTDPFSGSGYHYSPRTFEFTQAHPTEESQEIFYQFPGFHVYSVAWDRKDNGGATYHEEKNEDGMTVATEQDIVISIWNWTNAKGVVRAKAVKEESKP